MLATYHAGRLRDGFVVTTHDALSPTCQRGGFVTATCKTTRQRPRGRLGARDSQRNIRNASTVAS
jgi:hypothetical protein